MNLYIKCTLSFQEVAEQIRRILVEFDVQERDGLNLGGGDYFLFSCGDLEVVLVSNDPARADVFEPARAAFPFYCYVHRGPQDILGRVLAALPMSGLEGELGDEP